MKILQVTSGIAPESGGPTRSVKGLCRALSRAGVDVTLLVLHGEDEFENPCGVTVIRGLTTRTFSLRTLKHFTLVHLHGLWDPQLHQVVKMCQRTGVPYVVSPRGMLDPWALSVKKWKKAFAMLLYQRSDLRCAAAFHATAEAEAGNIRRQGFRQQIIVSPNGVDLPAKIPDGGRSGKKRTAIFMGRLHPGKGLVALAEAWRRVNPQGWEMRIVGPDLYGHQKEIESVLMAGGGVGDWRFVGAVNDERKWKEYAAADLMVHPSVSENFGMTIAEGLASSLPVICTKGTPWHDVRERNCGWWIDLGVEPLETALKEATSMTSGDLKNMGVRGRKLIEDTYLWPSVAQKLVQGYEKMLAHCQESVKLI